MKKQAVRGCLLLLSLCAVLSACSPKAPLLDYDNGVYRHEESGVSYLPASNCYEAVSINSDRVIARMDNKKMEDDLFYAIGDTDPNLYIATPGYGLFYADTLTLPTLEQMEPAEALICKTAAISYSLATVSDAEDLSALLAVYAGQGFDEEELICDSYEPDRYDLKFISSHSEYAAFYYTLQYHRYSSEVTVWEPIADASNFEIVYEGVEVTTETFEGDLYAVYHFGTEILFDRVTKTCYPLGSLLSGYLDGTDETGEA